MGGSALAGIAAQMPGSQSKLPQDAVVIDTAEVSDDLVQDMIDLMTCFSARLYGRRSARNRAKRAIEALKP